MKEKTLQQLIQLNVLRDVEISLYESHMTHTSRLIAIECLKKLEEIYVK